MITDSFNNVECAEVYILRTDVQIGDCYHCLKHYVPILFPRKRNAELFLDDLKKYSDQHKDIAWKEWYTARRNIELPSFETKWNIPTINKLCVGDNSCETIPWQELADCLEIETRYLPINTYDALDYDYSEQIRFDNSGHFKDIPIEVLLEHNWIIWNENIHNDLVDRWCIRPKKENEIITRKFGVDFNSRRGALTLDPSCVSDKDPEWILDEDDLVDWEKTQNQIFTKTHNNGWTISGKIHDDYYTWINDFEAHHPKYGKVWGNFESQVFADSEEGYDDFYKNFPPHEWDYGDI